MDYAVAVDQTSSVTEGIKEIVKTLLIALVLVMFVVYIFLQGWRSTLIPLLAVPVSLVGTFVVFPAFGFSVNTLSLFGLVLAIGLVVDDAIVVVEGVERHIEEGMTPKDAALKAMDELSGPVVGIALVLSAVFVPTAFIPGITGRLYQQFAVTIAISVLFSAFNALTLSPALAALLLRPKTESHGPIRKFFDWFNRVFGRATNGYVAIVRRADSKERRRSRDAGGLRHCGRFFWRPTCRRASCLTKTRGISSSTCNSRTRLRCNARTRQQEKSKKSWRIRPASSTKPASSALV